jgi:hypothetical protein
MRASFTLAIYLFINLSDKCKNLHANSAIHRGVWDPAHGYMAGGGLEAVASLKTPVPY